MGVPKKKKRKTVNQCHDSMIEWVHFKKKKTMEMDRWPASKLSHPTLACVPKMGIPQASIGWFISWKIRSYKWMRTGGTPILGNLHIIIYNITYITIDTLYRYYVVMTYHYVHQSSVLCVIITTTVMLLCDDAVGKINCRGRCTELNPTLVSSSQQSS